MVLYNLYPWSIPLIHTPDLYPWSIPLTYWKRIIFYANIAFGPRSTTPIATTVTINYCCYSRCYYRYYYRYYCCFSCLRCLRAATAVTSVAAPAGPAFAAGAGLFPLCASGNWINIISWIVITNIVNIPWRLVRPVLVLLGASCNSNNIMILIPYYNYFYFCITWYI